jgi:hypothetical protein
MRLTLAVMLFASAIYAQSPDERDVTAVVQKLFDAMAARDEAAIRATLLPDARLYSVRAGSAPSSVAADDWLKRIVASNVGIVERFVGPPAVTVRGRMAQLWGEYEFLRDGRFSHCGADTATLFKTAGGWKIAVLAFTMETTGCKRP